MTYTTGQDVQLTPEGLRIALGKCHDWNLDDPCIIKRISTTGNYAVQNNRSKEVFVAFEKDKHNQEPRFFLVETKPTNQDLF